MGNGFKISLILVLFYIGSALYDLSKNIGLNSIGKYQFQSGEEGQVTRMNTETGETDSCSLARGSMRDKNINTGDILCFSEIPAYATTTRHSYKEFIHF